MDGLTVEFYKAIRDIISVFIVDTLNCSYDKDKHQISNWRPISFINDGFKIASKAVAWRMQSVLQKLIHYNERAFVKGRSITDAIRAIEDVLGYIEIYGINGK